jgi:hypothetical protein
MDHDFDPTLTFDSAADLRLYRLRYLCRWPMRRIARHLRVHESTISRRLRKLDRLYRLKPLLPKRPAPKRRRFRPILLSQISNV